MVFDQIVGGFNAFLDFIFAPLLRLPPIWIIAILSFLITLLITVAYKYLTDQTEMKKLKLEMKDMQKEMKENKDKPDKMMEINKKMMEKNLKYMGMSFKSTLYTIIPLLLIFAWLNANFLVYPIGPNTEFTTSVIFEQGSEGNIMLIAPENIEMLNNKTQPISDIEGNPTAQWHLKSKEEGEYSFRYDYEGKAYYQDIIISKKLGEYAQPITQVADSKIKTLIINNDPIKMYGMSWIWIYIILSIAFSLILRKILDVH